MYLNLGQYIRMVIKWSPSIPEEDRPFMQALIESISHDTKLIVANPARYIIVTLGWHENPYVDPYEHFNIRYPPDHMMAGRDIHIHGILSPSPHGWYYDPVPT